MKKIFIVLFCLISLVSKAQVYQSMPQYGYGPVKRFDIDSSLTIPTTCGVPTLRTTLTKKAAIAFDSCNNKFYKYNPKTLTWSEISGGGSSIDTTSLSNRINAKQDTIRDLLTDHALETNSTAQIVSSAITKTELGYLNGVTSSIQTQLNNKLNISDTANKWVNGLIKKDDSTFYIIKGTTTDSISISGTTYATKLKTKVWNNSGATITKGSVIYINGKHSSNLPTIALAQANTEVNSYATFALVESDIADNSQGTVIQAGTISNLNLPTASYTDGDLLYLSPTIAGGYTKTKPLAPYHIVKLGTIVRAHPTFGTIELKIENGWQLDELSDVQIAAVPANNTLLQFSRTDSLWHDVSVTTAIGTNYIKPSDTASMLTPYLRNIDTASLSSRIDLKVNIADTSTMLNKYLRKIDTATLSDRINLKLNISDTSTMLSKYLRKTDTATLSSRINLKVNISDTATMLSPYLQSINYDNDLTKAYQLLGSSIKSVSLSVPSGTMLVTTATLTSQQLRLFAVYLPKAATITGVKWIQTIAGNYTASNYNGIGLYSYSGGTLTLVASSTDDGAVWKVSSTSAFQSKAFSSTYSASAGIYFIGALYSSSAQTTAPTIGAASTSGYNFDFTNSAKIQSTINTQTSLPNSQAMSGTTASTTNMGFWLY